MTAVEIILLVTGICVLLVSVYMLGRLHGDYCGYERAFMNWARRIETNTVEDDYVDKDESFSFRSFEQKEIKPKRRYYKKHAKRTNSLFDMKRHEIMNWYYKDLCGRVKPPKKITQRDINRMCREIAEEMGLTDYLEGKDGIPL